MATLEGKIAWITGGGTGIGRSSALELAAAGATVVVSGRRREALDAVAAEIKSAGGTADVEPLDVAIQAEVAAGGAAIEARHGRIDILVNSAGINAPNRFFKNLTAEAWDRVLQTNLNGTFYAIQAVLTGMRERRDGLVVNVASWAGKDHVYFTGAAYTASKHAMVAMTMSLHLEECMNGIRATAICPGEVATPILKGRPVPPSDEEIGRMLQPEDVGRSVRFVAEMPPHVTINEILITPTWNRMFLGGTDIAQPR
ncbi:MAG TPA: SDR family oxidoreductase [Aliidongia sp.]|uniref:SDR family oxidoreductase n=1 Tax=Aliidongia sp. TaxID=1914230 RepID=UPI002DDD68A4|nr:SDR family oxidoreductase [Aliidongia sp.]HEV2675864.1 SDR family oxidoreductase [Aliidongia sp.]